MARPGQLSDYRDLIAGAAGGLFAPLATFALGLPVYATLPGAVLVFFGLRMMLAPRELFEGLPDGKFARSRLDLAREVLGGAQRALAELDDHAGMLRDDAVKQQLVHLGRITQDVVAEVEKNPGRLTSIQRLLTYYLPAAVRLAEGYAALERKRHPSEKRLRETRDMIGRLDGIFSDYADRLVMPEVEGLDVELRLLDDAIREERLETGKSS